MRLFFATYIPEKGKIKNGDLIAYDEYKDDLPTGKKIGVRIANKKTFAAIEKLGYKPFKAKLVLCSANQLDIHVDDKVFCKSEVTGVVTRIEERVIWVKEDQTKKTVDWVKSSVYKIMGEISEEATFVKDRQSFNETQLADKAEDFVNAPWSEVDADAGQELRDDGMWKIAVRGCCEHFH